MIYKNVKNAQSKIFVIIFVGWNTPLLLYPVSSVMFSKIWNSMNIRSFVIIRSNLYKFSLWRYTYNSCTLMRSFFFVKISGLTCFSIDAHRRPGTTYILWRSCYNYHILLPPTCRTFFECVTYRRWYRIFPSTDRTVVLLPRM